MRMRKKERRLKKKSSAVKWKILKRERRGREGGRSVCYGPRDKGRKEGREGGRKVEGGKRKKDFVIRHAASVPWTLPGRRTLHQVWWDISRSEL